jgi:hypothetical protein
MNSLVREFNALVALAIVSVATACDGDVGGDATGGASTGAGGKPGVCAQSKNDEIRLLLAKSCESCHGENSNTPFFASLTSFDSLIVADPKYVVPGDANGSYLVALLEGKGNGLYAQMPPNGEPFAVLAAQGTTDIDVAGVKKWIDELGETPLNPDPDFGTISTRRLKTEELLASLMFQIGLDWGTDFVSGFSSNYDSPTVVLTGQLPVYSPDMAPPPHYGSDRVAEERFIALGGQDAMNRKPRNQSISAPFQQTLVQVSQAWCQMAVEKPGNTVFFAKATRDMTSAANQTEVKANIAYLYLRMLGEVATQTEIDATYDGVFAKVEPSGTDAAWTAVCASFVRHPLWLSL